MRAGAIRLDCRLYLVRWLRDARLTRAGAVDGCEAGRGYAVVVSPAGTSRPAGVSVQVLDWFRPWEERW